MGKVVITQVKSTIKKPKAQKLTMQALGLRGINKSVELENNPAVKGMIRTVFNLVEVKEL